MAPRRKPNARLKRPARPATKTERDKSINAFARLLGVPVAELRRGTAPRRTPWSTPLDRVTYPRAVAPLTDDYVAWLTATVADLAQHYRLAYFNADGSADVRANAFLAAARTLTALAVALASDDRASLEKLARSSRGLPLGPVRVPTTLYVATSGTQAGGPFVLEGDPAVTPADRARALVAYFEQRLRPITFFADGDPRRAHRLARREARATQHAAPMLPLVGRQLDDDRTEALATKFTRILQDVHLRRGSRRTANEAPMDEPAWAVERERLAMKFAHATLVAAGLGPLRARTLLDPIRKERERKGHDDA